MALPINDIRHLNLYDGEDVGEIVRQKWCQVFGNRNIGNAYLTNVQVPGQMAGDAYFVVQRWYARTNIPERDGHKLYDALRIWANSVVIDFIVGNRPMWTLSLFDLLDRRPRVPDGEQQVRLVGDPWPTVIPPRQNFMARINYYGGSGERLKQRVAEYGNLDGTNHPTGARVWLHIEGLEIRTDDHSPAVREMMARITSIPRERLAVEEQIAAWLRGVAIKAVPEDQALISVLRDGVLEGRHRGS